MKEPSFQPPKLSSVIGLWSGGFALVALIGVAMYSYNQREFEPHADHSNRFSPETHPGPVADESGQSSTPQSIQLPDTARRWFNTQLGTKFRMPEYAQASVTYQRHRLMEYQFKLPVESAEATITLQEWELDQDLNEHLMAYQRELAFHDKVSTSRDEVDFKAQNKFGQMAQLYGPVAAPLIFFVTDTTNVFIQGHFMFDHDPNLPRLKPMLDRAREDVWYMLETLKWE